MYPPLDILNICCEFLKNFMIHKLNVTFIEYNTRHYFIDTVQSVLELKYKVFKKINKFGMRNVSLLIVV